MKYDNIRAFEKHLESAAPQHFSNLYLIIGKDSFETKEALEILIQALIPVESHRSLCLEQFESQIEPDRVIQELNSLPFLCDKRVICFHQIDKSKKSVLEVLEKHLEKPPQSQSIILLAHTLAKNTTFYKKIEKAGIILELVEAKPWEKEKRLIEWLMQQMTNLRKLMSYQACQYLVKHSGCDQALLQQELDKLLCYVGDRKELSLQDIVAICTSINADTIWQLGEAIFRRESSTALRISRALLAEGHQLLPFIRQIRAQFQTGYHIAFILAQEGQTAQITQEFPYMKGQILERQIQLVRLYGLNNFKKGLLAIDALELRAKSSQVDDMLLADLLIAKLTTE